MFRRFWIQRCLLLSVIKVFMYDYKSNPVLLAMVNWSLTTFLYKHVDNCLSPFRLSAWNHMALSPTKCALFMYKALTTQREREIINFDVVMNKYTIITPRDICNCIKPRHGRENIINWSNLHYLSEIRWWWWLCMLYYQEPFCSVNVNVWLLYCAQ